MSKTHTVAELKLIDAMSNRWKEFKYLRHRKHDFDIGHKDYMTMKQREQLIDLLFDFIGVLDYD